jgi:hypothetical protein
MAYRAFIMTPASSVRRPRSNHSTIEFQPLAFAPRPSPGAYRPPSTLERFLDKHLLHIVSAAVVNAACIALWYVIAGQ